MKDFNSFRRMSMKTWLHEQEMRQKRVNRDFPFKVTFPEGSFSKINEVIETANRLNLEVAALAWSVHFKTEEDLMCYQIAK